MTLGEKIQFYRKKLGYSQEELGQQMLVSRQTVSLWEMDKTFPTIDNLVRLKDIFSVSVDELLSNQEPAKNSQDGFIESYTFQISKSEWRDIYNFSKPTFIKRIVFFLILLALAVVLRSVEQIPEMFIGATFSFAGFGLFICEIAYKNHKKAYQVKEKQAEHNYVWDFCEDYVILKVIKNNQIIKTVKIDFEDIELIQYFGDFVNVYYEGQNYVIKKSILDDNSVFYDYCNKNPQKVQTKNPNDHRITISTFLFVLSIATIFLALVCAVFASDANKLSVENMWVFFLFTPVPISSVIYGLFLKKRGYKYRKNIVVGIIMTFLLCMYGCFSFIF